jgi:TRAP-type C4-dicarboxylate transport system permease small subunit
MALDSDNHVLQADLVFQIKRKGGRYLDRFLDRAEKGLEKLSKWFNLGAAGALFAMMALVNANVFLRPLGKPIWGTFEIVGFLGTIVISFSLIHTTLFREHMAVEIITSRLPGNARRILDFVNRCICLVILALVAWQSAGYGMKVFSTGQVSATLKMPIYPFLYGIAFAFAVASVAVLTDLLRVPLRAEEK